MTHVLRYAARTDRGLLRANNQDSVFAGDRLLVIADGMGGHAAGDVASRLVVAAFVGLDELPQGSDMVRPLSDATRTGNAAIAETVEANPEFDGMGTTLTALLFDGPVVALAHVGDSRAYLFRNGVLHQISHDDTFVQSLVDDGRITADEATHHPQRSLLLRALNGTEMDPSITMRETSPGDRFLICSDGLSDVVSPESIADALGGPDPDSVADTLIQLALVGGGPDNVTVIVADVLETGGPAHHGIPGGGIDPEATGPMQPIHLTQKMPRVPLPPIPEDVAAKPEYVQAHDPTSELDDDRDDNGIDEDGDDDGGDDDGDDHGGDDDGSDHDGYDDDGSGGPATRVGESDDGPGRSRNGRNLDHRLISAPPHRWGRRGAFALAVLVLLGVGLGGSYLWASSKYYVGENGEQVAVFRGVNGSLLGLRFASVQEDSCGSGGSACRPLKVDDLVQAARAQVSAGIAVGTLTDARNVITRLTSQQLPPCPSAAASILPIASSPAKTAPAARLASSSPAFPTRPMTKHSATTNPGTTASTASLTLAPAGSGAASRPAASGSSASGSSASGSSASGSVPSTGTGAGAGAAGSAPAVPLVPVTTTVTVTLDTAAALPSGAPGVGQRLRGDRQVRAAAPTTARTTTKPLVTTTANPPVRTTARPATTAKPARPATTPATRAPVRKAPVTKASVTRTPVTRAPVSSRPATPGPVTRAIPTTGTPTVTVFTTVPGTGSAATESVDTVGTINSISATGTAESVPTGTPLVSPAARPGITCRPVS